jgi:hypothetical protein
MDVLSNYEAREGGPDFEGLETDPAADLGCLRENVECDDSDANGASFSNGDDKVTEWYDRCDLPEWALELVEDLDESFALGATADRNLQRAESGYVQ